jgi:hypothetical protein
MLDLIWMTAREGRRDGVGSNEYGLGLGVNAGRRVGSRWKSGREAFPSREAGMRRDLTSRRGDVGMLASIALAKLAPHLVLSGRYGYWIDELYFLACGDHLAWGYVDMPTIGSTRRRCRRPFPSEKVSLFLRDESAGRFSRPISRERNDESPFD